MDLYKPICKHVVIPLWAKWERTSYLKHLDYLERSQYFPEEDIRRIQWTKIRRLLGHAYSRCEFYKRRFDQEGIHPDDIRSFEDFRSIPILRKEDAQQNSEDMLSANADKYQAFLTSGSTGIPLRGYISKDSSGLKRACAVRNRLWSGSDQGERTYLLYGNPEKELRGLKKLRAKIRGKLLDRTEVLDLLQVNEGSMLHFAEKMRRKPPSLLWGHAHGLYLLANFLEKKKIHDIRPKGMYSAGMVLHKWERRKVEHVFQCKLQDRYGCEEVGGIASECKKQEGLHLNTDVHYVEFLDKDGKPVPSGNRGIIVVTDLTNFAMPFIRYRLGDVGIPSAKKCSCGRTQPLIEKIEGRTADFLVTPEGHLVSGVSLTDHFGGHMPGVVQMQIVQEKVDLLRLKIVKDRDFGEESERKISQLVGDFFGPRMNFHYEFKREIPLTGSGKYQFAICKVKHDLL